MNTPVVYENRMWCQSCGWSYVDNPTSAPTLYCPDCGGGFFANQAPQITRGAVMTIETSITPAPRPWRPKIVTDDMDA